MAAAMLAAGVAALAVGVVVMITADVGIVCKRACQQGVHRRVRFAADAAVELDTGLRQCHLGTAADTAANQGIHAPLHQEASQRAVAEIEAEGTHMSGWLKKVYAVMIRFVTPALILIVEIGGLQSEIAAGNTAVIVFAYALVALCVVAYFAFFRNRDTGTNADEKLSGDYPV